MSIPSKPLTTGKTHHEEPKVQAVPYVAAAVSPSVEHITDAISALFVPYLNDNEKS